ncbi:MAG: hypothetical protein SOZ80_02330 [Prevotella sp.]|uniref:hypothetical protein n=1 Tax=Prevotella sp. TaxID=59823 RepID=UPI002A268649|nr:hypothetical protein [Prevotella sp.]MDD7319120.1 hypothetical protein [Prevotellaceae bacterium]MDY4019605.1 hypothetical protein [Prevotella sp.]
MKKTLFAIFTVAAIMFGMNCCAEKPKETSENLNVPTETSTTKYQQSNVKLSQEGDFDEFFKSLAECYAAGATEEIKKIVLVNADGKRVIMDETMIPEEYDYGNRFINAINNNKYSADEANYALFYEWDLAGQFGLDEDELSNNAIIWLVESSEDVLAGWYYKYKGKWYLWHMF